MNFARHFLLSALLLPGGVVTGAILPTTIDPPGDGASESRTLNARVDKFALRAVDTANVLDCAGIDGAFQGGTSRPKAASRSACRRNPILAPSIFPPTADFTFTYHAINGRLTSVTDAVGTISHTAYDNNGNLLTTSETRAGITGAKTTTRTYDRQDRLASRTDDFLPPLPQRAGPEKLAARCLA